MIRRPPRSTRTDTLFPYTTLFRSPVMLEMAMKGKRTNLGNADCGIARSLEVVGDWWSLLIAREAFKGRERFGEFQKAIGLAKNILSARLKKLVEHDIFRIEIGRAHV